MFQPIKNKLFVKVLEKKVTAGGIIIPEGSTETPIQEGIVRAVGKEVREVSEGDHVLFQNFLGQPAIIDDEKGYVLLENEILAIL